MWRWWSDEGWTYYSLENSAIIERSWRNKEINIIINIGGIPFLLNLRHFYQFNFITQRHRRISRDISSAVWFWTDNNGQLNLYQPNVSAQIERYYLHIQWNLVKSSNIHKNNKKNQSITSDDTYTFDSADKLKINNSSIVNSNSSNEYLELVSAESVSKENVREERTNMTRDCSTIQNHHIQGGGCIVWGHYDIYPIECIQINRITGKERRIFRKHLKNISEDNENQLDQNGIKRITSEPGCYLEWQFTDTKIARISDAISLIVETGEFYCVGYPTLFSNEKIMDLVYQLPDDTLIDDDCCLCLHPLIENRIKLKKCHHVYHKDCFFEMVRHLKQKNVLNCPLCMSIQDYGKGASPYGRMRYIVYKAGNIEIETYPSTNVIEIEYFIPSGIQNERHPNPSKPFSGTYKIAYLPYDKDGIMVLNGLIKAFKLGHTFKVISIPNISENVNSRHHNDHICTEIVQWNSIPHKISTCGGPTLQGFPDPYYFNLVIEKLASVGIDCNAEM
ncbi:zinc finger, C3HC4 type domain-containing protein [Cryptosporidium muris RN66]|uniref:RING-type E3 ubiquitin transferase n=1 Tax=Cryptosporidium muris (strain RN66) TaxID=441375 RepID=B6AJK9_CRYMR|nr:zinc finger, C3HC4 type domain-containing protein [Cryptosporidium muris RN66]EEA08400.1 zinc finger, C3HC4 type domain-containing protein [Cryptosporidium muris RN66]|eukprot:XP_002142749.1 zinc finger, C3HC4 type domain-containing protein [Cryptosporidium muris RN66]